MFIGELNYIGKINMKVDAENYNQPLFTIGIVASMIRVTQTTLRIWEKKGLIKPERLGKNRYYSYCDLDRLKKIHHLLQDERMNIVGVKSVLEREKCWEIKKCGDLKNTCKVYLARKES